MSELKDYIGPHPIDHTLTEYYLKSEADKVIASHKYKRCLAMAELAVKDDYAPWNMKWHNRWLAIADKFKEAK